MTVTDDQQSEVEPARAAVNDMLEAGLLDSVMERAAAGELALTGEGGFLPELVRSVLERGLSTELSEHLGYEKGAGLVAAACGDRRRVVGRLIRAAARRAAPA